MFTGIIEEIGIVKGASPGRLTIGAKTILEDMKLGDSIAVNGACLTVSALARDNFSVDIMPETVRRTNIRRLHYGDKVNLERAMLALGRFGGHFVQGHVDGVGTVTSLTPEETAVIAKISVSSDLMRYVVSKGFVAIDGCSLTVIECDTISLLVSLVAYTREHTTLGVKKTGDTVNVEVDVMAKYVEKLNQMAGGGVTLEFLGEHGFLKAR
ncbi:MAG: riboflavin synthase [Chloroflexi bacterium]|nr:riboflavin synthase [Chloroflexota bacterium]MBM3172366.1 riboflavin synthase [Chloroflexota bacterium]